MPIQLSSQLISKVQQNRFGGNIFIPSWSCTLVSCYLIERVSQNKQGMFNALARKRCHSPLTIFITIFSEETACGWKDVLSFCKCIFRRCKRYQKKGWSHGHCLWCLYWAPHKKRRKIKTRIHQITVPDNYWKSIDSSMKYPFIKWAQQNGIDKIFGMQVPKVTEWHHAANVHNL